MVKIGHIRRALTIATMGALAPWSVQAQTQAAPATAPADDNASQSAEADKIEIESIVVTGTFLRAIAPTGTNLIQFERDDVLATGVASTNDLMANIPQISNFNTIPRGTASFGQPIVQTNLRNLGASGGTTTLVLMNGHRLVGSGILQTYVDPAIIPPGVIERVEVIPDGGSSIYGSDAIGGVINFITRKDMDGVEATGRYGFADNYHTVDANLTAGSVWDEGSFLFSYAYAQHDNIQGIDRDYFTQNNTASGGTDFRSATCPVANITVGTVNYALPGLQPNTQNRCDTTDYVDIYPEEERHSVFASLEQTLNDSLDFSLEAYWSLREATALTAQLASTGTITSANPYFRSVNGETSHRVAFSYDDVFGPSLENPAKFSSAGITPTFTLALGDNWQARAMFNYGRSSNDTREAVINTTAAAAALAGTSTATALNPYDLSATNPAVLAPIRNYANFSHADQEIAETRVVADGSVFELPGGDVKLAVGGEVHYENVSSWLATGGSRTATTARAYASRDVASAFAEVLVPIFGDANGMPGLRRLDLSASVRYDHYSDVGDTTNPKLGVTYEPFDGFSIRGNVGSSFHAPSLADTEGSVDSRLSLLQTSAFRAGGSPQSDFLRPSFLISGGNPALKPEEADTWSLGFDWQPSFLSGLNVSATYYNVEFSNAIGIGRFFTGPAYFAEPSNQSLYILNPTIEQVRAWSGGLRLDAFPSIEGVYANGVVPYVLFDARRYNLGAVNTDGLDFSVMYNHATSFGSIWASAAGNYTLSRETQVAPGGAFTDNLKNGTGRMLMSMSIGTRIGDFSARATANYRDDYPILGLTNQRAVDSFTVLDLFFGYELKNQGWFQDTSLLLNLDNILDEEPPYQNNNTGNGNGSTFGRLIALGFKKSF